MLCYSTGSLPQVPFSEIISILEPSPFKGVELVITPAMLERSGEKNYWKNTEKLFQDRGLEIRNLHLGSPHLLSTRPHEPGIASPDSKERKLKLDCITRCIEMGSLLESRTLTFTTGLPKPDCHLSDHIKYLHESIDLILEQMPADMQLAIEQEPEHVVHSTEQMKDLCDHYSNKLMLTFDIGHSQVLAENIPQCLEILLPYIVNLHFEDISGNIHKHKLFGEGEIDFKSVFNKLEELNYSGDYTPDLYPFSDSFALAMDASETFFAGMGILK